MPAEGCSDFLQLIFQHCGETISERHFKSVVPLAVFHQDTGSLQLLRQTFGHIFLEKAIEDLRNGPCSFSSRLLWVSEHGDLADFQGFLTSVFEDGAVSDRPDSTNSDHHLWRCVTRCRDLIEKIAELGRVDLVEALLAELQSKIRNTSAEPTLMPFVRRAVLHAACRKGNFAMASSVLRALYKDPKKQHFWFFFEEILDNDALCTAHFLESGLVWVKANIANNAHQRYCFWLGKMVRKAITLHRRPHLEILLDEIDRIGYVLPDFWWFLLEVLRSKSTSMLRIFLLRYPEAFINDTWFDPVQVLCDHHWTMGARTLVEAGAVTKGNVPQEYAEVFKLSLEDRCRIVARRNTKRPLEQNVHQLPLPMQVKRRILYRKPT